MISRLRTPAIGAARPSATVCTFSMGTGEPASSARRTASAPVGSTPMTRAPGRFAATAPATLELSSAEVELFNAIGREIALRDKLSQDVVQRYAYVLIDCPPTLGLLTLNALVAANGVIIPVQTQYYALKGVAALLKIIKTVHSRLNPKLKVLGLLPTFYDSRTILGRDMLDSLRELGDHQVFETVIRQSVKIGEAPTAGVPIGVYEPRSDAAKSFADLAREVIGAHK